MENKIYKHNDGPCKELTKDISVLMDVLNSLVEDNSGEFKFEYDVYKSSLCTPGLICIKFYFEKLTLDLKRNMLIKKYEYEDVESLDVFFKHTYKDIIRMLIFTRDFDNGAIKSTEFAKIIRNYGK